MQDVADLVGVSKQTVSAVINGKPGITEETQARVRAAIDQLGYRLDFMARSLRTRQTHTIALLITDVSSLFLSKIASVAEDCAYQAHYNLVLYNTREDPEREDDYIESVMQRSVDGVLFVSSNDNSRAVQRLELAGVPVVVLDRTPRGYDGPSVTLDNRATGRLVAEHLLDLGHRRLAHIAGPESVHISEERLAGFLEVVHGRGVPEPVIERARGWRVEPGYEAAHRLIETGSDFTAVFAAGDQVAIGAMRALREAGRRIPADVSLVGIDDIDMDAFLCPPLTTVSQSIPRMAELGVGLLLDLIAGQAPEQVKLVIKPELVVRESTAAR
jgi:DNA-binding LacI/PurR family transcriptional regulator